jgi:predicted CXXCH cytochrome family protein
MLSSIGSGGTGGYLGSDVCAGCHKDIAATQVRTNMARTWHAADTRQLAANYSETYAEGPAPPIEYGVKRTGQKLQYRVQMPGQPALEFPVETIVGGERHGLVFLFRVASLEGSSLAREPLVEDRYFHSVRKNGLALELGLPEEKPSTYETALGRILTPNLEKRCLSCHAAPRTYGTRIESGVGCESCHGPGQQHLAALSRQTGGQPRDLGILNPSKLPVAERMQPCEQCHAGTTVIEDAMPDETLISAQVMGLKNSECWRQSAGDITCTNCHDPHRDAAHTVLVARSEKTCLRCHSAVARNHAGLCPVNRMTGCIGCHMPDKVDGAFVLAEHWIRVHPEQKVKVTAHNPAWITTVTPKHLYLRMMVLDDREKATSIRQQLLSGGSFFELARANSIDRDTAINGGFLGDLEASKLDPAWSAPALKLQPGELSDVIEANGRYFLLQRMARNFREDAEAKFDEAMKLRKEAKQQESAAGLLEALKIYPQFLRALTYWGITCGEMGNPQAAAGILGVATRLYPNDEGAHFNLGVAYGATGNADEISEYKRTIEIDADYVPAYLNWGGALFNKGKYDEAIQIYKQGVHVDPLNAALHYSLGVALDRIDQKQEAEAEMTLAGKIDPKYAQH